MTIFRAQVTTDTFDSTTGRLIPAGGLIDIDTSTNELTKENSSNLRTPGNEPLPAPVIVAAIAPTGPNPTTPQQVPPGAVQTFGGYQSAQGAPFVAEGSVAAAEHLAAQANSVTVEEGAIEPGPLDGSVTELTAYLNTVNDPAALAALKDAETAGKSRKGALDAIDARTAALSLS